MSARKPKAKLSKKDIYPITIGILVFLLALAVIRLFLLDSLPSSKTAEYDKVSVPILMYHGILKDPSRSGKYVITPDELEADLIWLRDNGFETISAAQLKDYSEHGTPLPAKPIMLTFDDGYYNNYLYAYPLLQKYQAKAVIAVIGIHSEKYSLSGETNAYYTHITWDQMREMYDSGLVEFSNHSYNLHSNSNGRLGCGRKKGEGKSVYQELLTEDLTRCDHLIAEQTGISLSAFTYPYGIITNESQEVVRRLGYSISFSCSEGINHLRPGDPLYSLKRMLRQHGQSAAQMHISQ